MAANYCWRSVIRGGRVQCVYNAEFWRERKWGHGTLYAGRRSLRMCVVIGGGPAGLEYARVAAARGHDVVVLEREAETGGYVRKHSLLPVRKEYAQIGHWLLRQATGNCAYVRTYACVDECGLDALLAAERLDHVVVATGSRYRETAGRARPPRHSQASRPRSASRGSESPRCEVTPSGSVLVLDYLQDANAR